MRLFAFIVAAAFTALNVALYVITGSPWSLGGAIFCGAMAVFNLAMGVTDAD